MKIFSSRAIVHGSAATAFCSTPAGSSALRQTAPLRGVMAVVPSNRPLSVAAYHCISAILSFLPVKRSADFGCAVIRQGEPAAEQYKRRRKDGHGQNGHHQAQTQQGFGALYCHRAGLLRVAHKTDEVQPDAGQEYRHTGGSLDHKGLHGKDNALLPASGLELTVIHAVGKEQGGQHGQHSVAGEHHHARNAQQGKAVGQAGQAEHQQRAVAAQRQHKAELKYLRAAELFAQQRVKHHHAKNLRRTAHGGKQGVGGFPACTAKVVFEEIDDDDIDFEDVFEEGGDF